MSAPRVSIVLPVYNGAAFLRESLDSIVAQTAPDWELIAWDDGSTDASLELLRWYADPRIRVFSSAHNQGLFETLNAAIRQSRGEFVRLWSQDDVMKRDCLEIEAVFHERHPQVAMSYCRYDTIDEQGRVVQPARDDETPEVIPPAIASQIMFHHGSITGNIANVTLKRRTLDEVGLFRTDMRVAGDFEMWVRIAEHHAIGFIPSPLVKLRSHPGQFSRRHGINVAFMRECRPIVDSLAARFPAEARRHVRQYRRRHHALLDGHYMLRCLLGGQLRLAASAYREMGFSERPWLIMILLLVTLDGRVFRPTPRYFAV